MRACTPTDTLLIPISLNNLNLLLDKKETGFQYKNTPNDALSEYSDMKEMIEICSKKQKKKLERKISCLEDEHKYLKKDFEKLLDIKKVKPTTKKGKEPSYISSIGKVLFADIMISFDNVIGVVAAAKGYFGFMIFGLMLSVVLTGALATYMANYIQKHLWIAYVGLVFILLVGLQLVIGGLVDLEILNINEEFKKYF